MSDTGPFAVGDAVLVPHTDRFYEAKVLRAQKREDGQWYYLIHYIGWNKKWDEWVEQSGLQPAADAAALGLLQPAAKKQKSSAGGATAAAAAAAWQRGKTSHDGGAGGGGGGGGAGGGGGGAVAAGPAGLGLDVELTGALRQRLLDDYAAVQEQGRLIPLPRTPSVADICRRYLAAAKAERAASSDRGPSAVPLNAALAAAAAAADADFEDFVNGLCAYFDKALAHCLLYPSERSQARGALAGGALPSSIYGAEHLMRLFVKLPELLPQVPAMTQDHLETFRKRLEGVLTYIQRHAPELFLPPSGYELAPSSQQQQQPGVKEEQRQEAAAFKQEAAAVAVGGGDG